MVSYKCGYITCNENVLGTRYKYTFCLRYSVNAYLHQPGIPKSVNIDK